MDFLTSLWLPIIASAVALWIVSTIAWTVMPHHKRDWIGLPAGGANAGGGGGGGGEDAFMQAVRSMNIPPGNYIFPDCRGKAAMDKPHVKEAIARGPIGHLSLWPTPLTMADKMAWTFLLYLIVTIGIAYLTHTALPTTIYLVNAAPGTTGTTGPVIDAPTFAEIFRIAGTAGVLAYAFSFIPNMIWFGAYKRSIIASLIDGIVYGLLTGLIFAWLWPTP